MLKDIISPLLTLFLNHPDLIQTCYMTNTYKKSLRFIHRLTKVKTETIIIPEQSNQLFLPMVHFSSQIQSHSYMMQNFYTSDWFL